MFILSFTVRVWNKIQFCVWMHEFWFSILFIIIFEALKYPTHKNNRNKKNENGIIIKNIIIYFKSKLTHDTGPNKSMDIEII